MQQATATAQIPPVQQGKPPGWAADDLTKFIEAAHQNQYATFHKKKEAVSMLVAIDDEFAKITKGWLNPQNELAAMLLIRCHGAFRTSAALAMGGQCAEAYVQCRSMLEYAAYAVHIARDTTNSLGTLWLNRHVDDPTMKKQRREFGHDKVLESVTAANKHAGERFEKMYQQTIDFGGHPNERSVTGNMKMVEEPGRITMLAILLHGDGLALDAGLKAVARCGMISLEILEIVFSAKFVLLGIKEAMLTLRRQL
jgi:hypothetical protein